MSARVRPLRPESEFTCDWGGCERVATAERFDDESGRWLSGCRGHSGHGLDLVRGEPKRQSPGRKVCPECGKALMLLVDGRMRAHNRGFAERCPLSGRVVA